MAGDFAYGTRPFHVVCHSLMVAKSEIQGPIAIVRVRLVRIPKDQA